MISVSLEKHLIYHLFNVLELRTHQPGTALQLPPQAEDYTRMYPPRMLPPAPHLPAMQAVLKLPSRTLA